MAVQAITQSYDHPNYTTMRQHTATEVATVAGIKHNLTFRSHVACVVTDRKSVV